VALAALAVVLAALGALGVGLRNAWRRLRRHRRHDAVAQIVDLDDSTVAAPSGAVRSTQAAELIMPRATLEAIWTPMHLERLARTYWRFLSRCTLGLIRVVYSERERFVVLLGRPLVLLRFQAPEYEMTAERGMVRWRIASGLLVSRRGRGGVGYLQIDVRRRPDRAPDRARVQVEVEVASFYPAIALGISRRLYGVTQSRIHVIVTHGFLRSLARLDLAESRVGRYATASAGAPAGDGPQLGPVVASLDSPDGAGA
jgi:hypothetical protein